MQSKRKLMAATALTSLLFSQLLFGAVGPTSAIVAIPRASSQPPITDSWTETRQGELDQSGNCHYSISFHSDSLTDTTPILARLVSIDTDSCEYVVEYGVPEYIPGDQSDDQTSGEDAEDGASSPDVNCSAVDIEETADDANPAGCDSEAGSESVRAMPDVRSNDPSALHTHNDRSVTFSVYWEDPAQLDVNKVRTAVRSHTSGSQYR